MIVRFLLFSLILLPARSITLYSREVTIYTEVFPAFNIQKNNRLAGVAHLVDKKSGVDPEAVPTKNTGFKTVPWKVPAPGRYSQHST